MASEVGTAEKQSDAGGTKKKSSDFEGGGGKKKKDMLGLGESGGDLADALSGKEGTGSGQKGSARGGDQVGEGDKSGEDAKDDKGNQGGSWTPDGVAKIIAKTDTKVIEDITNNKITIISFETAFDKWRYDDGRVEENELKGLLGNTKKPKKEIRIRKSLSNEEAATTLFHELAHMGKPQATEQTAALEEEIQVRIETEEFAIRQGMPPTVKGYRTEDGKVDKAAIRKSVEGSSHYNPIGRTRIGRRYVGEATTSGWEVPKTK